MRSTPIGLVISLAAALVACQPTIPLTNLNLTGQFVYIEFDGNLWIQDARGGNARILMNSDKGTYPNSPAISPDGQQVAFAASVIESDQSMREGIQVIYVDGTDRRVLARPDDAAFSYGDPAWSPDGQQIYFTRSSPTFSNGQAAEVDRISVTGGSRVEVIDGVEASVSPDGKEIVFQRLDPNRYTPSLWIADIDGSNAKQLMENGTFAAIYGMRFSPDSQSIVFAASGSPNKKLPGIQADENRMNLPGSGRSGHGGSCAISLLLACLVETAEAHGPPWDLWLVNLDGTQFQRLTNIGSDSPVPAWSHDGKSIAFFDANGLHLLDLQTKVTYNIPSAGGFGGFDWR